MKNIFSPNEGSFDRVLRVTLGLTFVVASLISVGVLKFLFLIGALVLIITGLTGFCGLYKLFGINTCKVNSKKKPKSKRK